MLLLDQRRSRQAFTLIEVIVVVVVMGILASIASVSYTKVTDNAKDAAAVALVQQLHREATALAVLRQHASISEDDFLAAAQDASASAAGAATPASSGVLAAGRRVRLARELVGRTWSIPPTYSPDSTTLQLQLTQTGGATSALRSDTGNCVMGRQDSVHETAEVWVVRADLGTNCSSGTAVRGSSAQTTAGAAIVDTSSPTPDVVGDVTVADTGAGVKVTFAAPAYLGTSPVMTYKVIGTDGTQQVETTTTTTSAVLPEVPNTGTPWTFAVTALNAAGAGPAVEGRFDAPTVDGAVTPVFVQTGTAFSCPNGGAVQGGLCVTPSGSYPALGTTSYACPSGGTLAGTSCTKPATSYDAAARTDYSCPSGGSLSGTTCTLASYTYAATGSTSYACSSGDSLSGTTCTRPGYSYTASSYTSYYCDSGTLSGSQCYHAGYTYPSTVVWSPWCSAGEIMTATNCIVPATSYTATRSSTGTYSCPSGGSLSGTTCTIAARYLPLSKSGVRTCPSGGTSGGTDICTVAGYYTTASTSTSYSCSSGGTRSGTTCTVSSSTYAATASTRYSCPSGGSLAGSTCTVGSTTYAATGAVSYSCPSGGTLNGLSCTMPATSYTAAATTTYACTEGDILDGSTCASREASYAGTGTPVGHNTFTLTSVVATKQRLVTVNGQAVTPGVDKALGRCPNAVTLTATGLGGQTDTLLGSYCN